MTAGDKYIRVPGNRWIKLPFMPHSDPAVRSCNVRLDDSRWGTFRTYYPYLGNLLSNLAPTQWAQLTPVSLWNDPHYRIHQIPITQFMGGYVRRFHHIPDLPESPVIEDDPAAEWWTYTAPITTEQVQLGKLVSWDFWGEDYTLLNDYQLNRQKGILDITAYTNGLAMSAPTEGWRPNTNNYEFYHPLDEMVVQGIILTLEITTTASQTWSNVLHGIDDPPYTYDATLFSQPTFSTGIYFSEPVQALPNPTDLGTFNPYGVRAPSSRDASGFPVIWEKTGMVAEPTWISDGGIMGFSSTDVETFQYVAPGTIDYAGIGSLVDNIPTPYAYYEPYPYDPLFDFHTAYWFTAGMSIRVTDIWVYYATPGTTIPTELWGEYWL